MNYCLHVLYKTFKNCNILTKENFINNNYKIQFLALFLIISWSQNIKHTEIKFMNNCVLHKTL